MCDVMYASIEGMSLIQIMMRLETVDAWHQVLMTPDKTAARSGI